MAKPAAASSKSASRPSTAGAIGNRGGILPMQVIRTLLEAGQITSAAPLGLRQIQPASLDLRLGDVAYRVRASFLPGPGAAVTAKRVVSRFVSSCA